MTTASPVVLEPAAQELADATSHHPFLYELDPTAARKVLDDLQAAPVDKLPVDEEWVTVPAAVGDVRVRIVKPQGATGTLPVVFGDYDITAPSSTFVASIDDHAEMEFKLFFAKA